MQFNQHILVVINPERDDQVALDKAIRLSEGLSTKITALVRKKHAVPKLLATLDQKLSVANKSGIRIAVEISEEKDLFRAIMRTLHRSEFGLLIKEAHTASISDHVFLPDDWKLLRNSIIPVLLVHTDNEWQDSDILLCIDANPKDSEHQALNDRIIQAGRFIREVGNTHIHIATAYPPDMQSGGGKTKTLEQREGEYGEACRDILAIDEYMMDAQIHVDQGPAELLIPQIAEQFEVKLVVLGTVARSGLKSILLGNTCEQIIGRLETDILVLPPE